MTRPAIVILLCIIAGVLAVAVWRVRRPRADVPHTTLTRTADNSVPKCAEWEQAEASAQSSNWDLSYEAVLRKNGFGPDRPFWKWIHQDGPRPPVGALAAAWQGEPIVSAILVEIVGPEGSPGGFWLIRTPHALYRWDFNKGKFDRQKEALPALHEYDQAFAAIACWQQGVPAEGDTLFGGYYGFLSLYRAGKSRQMLLTFRDFFLADPSHGENISANPNNWGRLWKTLAPFLSLN